jgi:hypothetical protein
MAFYIRPQSPRGTTLGIAFVLWLVGLPWELGRWALLLAGALLILGCMLKGL